MLLGVDNSQDMIKEILELAEPYVPEDYMDNYKLAQKVIEDPISMTEDILK